MQTPWRELGVWLDFGAPHSMNFQVETECLRYILVILTGFFSYSYTQVIFCLIKSYLHVPSFTFYVLSDNQTEKWLCKYQRKQQKPLQQQINNVWISISLLFSTSVALSPDSRGSVALFRVASMDFKSTSGGCQNWQQRIDPSQLCSVQWPIMLYPEGCHYDPAALPQFIASVFSCCFRKWLLTIQVHAAYTIQSSEAVGAVDPAAPPVCMSNDPWERHWTPNVFPMKRLVPYMAVCKPCTI